MTIQTRCHTLPAWLLSDNTIAYENLISIPPATSRLAGGGRG
ncbi:hypothetical protein OAF62_02055 [Akkermansiaceae bacterium]|nr:hypothetical protein [Akkermansiaceae bacterium]